MTKSIHIAVAGLVLFAAGCADSTKPASTAGNTYPANSPQTAANTQSPPTTTPAQPAQHTHSPGAIPFPTSPRIPLEQAKADFDRGTALFIDTHSALAFAAEHIKGAINISNNDLDARANLLPKGKKLIVYCS